jgi:hypothetical protein
MGMNKRILAIIAMIFMTVAMLSGNIVAAPSQINNFGRQAAEQFLRQHPGLFMENMEWLRDDGEYLHFLLRDPETGEELRWRDNLALRYRLYDLDGSEFPIIVLHYSSIDAYASRDQTYRFVDGRYQRVNWDIQVDWTVSVLSTRFDTTVFYKDAQGRLIVVDAEYDGPKIYYITAWNGRDAILEPIFFWERKVQDDGAISHSFKNFLTDELFVPSYLNKIFTPYGFMSVLEIEGVPDTPLTLIEPLSELHAELTAALHSVSVAPATSDPFQMTAVITALILIILIALTNFERKRRRN